jgi:hypothetical protein
METSELRDEPTVHMHRRSTDAWYVSACGKADTSSYITLNSTFVTCEECRAEIK